MVGLSGFKFDNRKRTDRGKLAVISRANSRVPNVTRRKTKSATDFLFSGNTQGRKSERPAASGPANRTVQCLPPRPRRTITVEAEARTHERAIRTLLFSHLHVTLSRPRPPRCYRLGPRSTADPLVLREPTAADGGDLQFGAAERRSTARGGCRRGRRGLARACNSQQHRGRVEGCREVAREVTDAGGREERRDVADTRCALGYLITLYFY